MHLREADGCVEVLRLTMVLGRVREEIVEAAAAVCRNLRTADISVAMGRADMVTKAAVRLALELGLKIERSVRGL